MKKIRRLVGILFFIFAGVLKGLCDEPVKATVCELKRDPRAYNHKLVEVTGFVSHGFEDFTLFDPDCPPRPSVWLEYGGLASSGTMYCCGVKAERSRSKPLVVDNISTSLADDERFRVFDKLVHRSPDTVVHGTVVGRFFSGKATQSPNGVLWRGYGHLGCCSLLVIEQITSVDPQDRADLDYRAAADAPNIDKEGCGYRYLLPVRAYAELIAAQRRADLGQEEWSFDDPERVASDALAGLLNINRESIKEIRQTRKGQGRIVYEWRPKSRKVGYMIVVSRPYLLSFYAKDSKRIPWVPIAAYETSCN